MRNRFFYVLTACTLFSLAASAATLVANPSPLLISQFPGSYDIEPLSISSSGGAISGLTLSVSTSSGGMWLQVSPTTASTTPTLVYVFADARTLQTGTYDGTITVMATGAATLTIPVKFTVGQAPTPTPTPTPSSGSLTVSPVSLSFTGQAGGPQPGSKQLSVSSDTSGTTFSAGASTTNGGNWLQLSPTSGSTPATLTASVNTTGLSIGTYNGNIAMTPTGGTEVDVPVTLTLSSGSALTVDSSGLTYFYQIGSLVPTPQTFKVTGGTSPLAFNASAITTEGTGWLSVTPASGTTPQTETVSVSPLNLQAGVYHGKITVAATSAANGSVDVPVTLTVTAGALLTVGSPPTPFVYQTGGAPPAPQTVSIGTVGDPLKFTVASSTTDGGTWLSVSPLSGTTPQNLTITVDPGSLAPGSYSGAVIVTSATASNSPIKIPVTLTITSNSTISASVQQVVLNYQIGGADEVLSQPLTVTSTSGPVNVTASATASTSASSCPPGWLQVSPASVTTPGVVNVTLSPVGFSQPQNCLGSVVLSGGGAPIQIPVIAVAAATPFFNVRPLAFSFTAPYQSPTEIVQNIDLSTTNAAPAAFSTAVVTSSGGSWLSVAPSSGSTKASISVIADPYNLPVGNYSGSIKISSAALPQAQVIPVSLTVTPTSTASVTPASLSFVQPIGGTPPPAQNVILAATGGSQSFTASAAQGNLPGAVLSVTPLNGNTPGILTVSLMPNTLPAGSYDASVSIAVPAAGATPITVPVKITVGNPPPGPTIAATPATLAFNYLQGGDIPAMQQIAATSSGAALAVTASATTASGGNWLTVTPGSGSTPVSFTIAANPAGLAAATYTGTVTLTPAAGGGPAVAVPVTLVVTAPPPAPMKISAVANAASGVRGPISPGEIVTIGGVSLGPASPAGLNLTASGSVDTTDSGVQVLFDEAAAPLLYVSGGQINAIVPYEVAGRSTVEVAVVNQGTRSDPYIMQLSPAAPGLFTGTQNGRGQGAILNQDNSYNGASSPAARGDIVQVFGTGEGLTQPANLTGSITQGLNLIAAKVSATVGGVPAEVVFAGAAPRAVAGLFQINVRIPTGAPSGDDLIAITIGGVNTQTGVTVAVQ